jgi:ATP phosphoribosyltransferase regulatory subunit
VLQGGRYDDLLARYGHPSPAVGFAVDVDAVAGAMETAAPARPGAKSRRARINSDASRDGARRTKLAGSPRDK